MELGETFEESARRELKEATGLEVGELRPLKLFIGPEYRFTSPNGDITENVSQLFEARLPGR